MHDSSPSGSGVASLPSCNGCKHRKLKCSRDLPVCANCKRLETACEYDQHKSKPGMKSGIVSQLTRRIEELEHKLYDNDVPVDRAVSLSPLRSTGQRVALPKLETPKLNEGVTNLSKEIQKLNSTIGSLTAAMLSPDGSNVAPRVLTRKRVRRDAGFPTECQPCKRLSMSESELMDRCLTGLLDALEGRLLTVLVDTFFVHIGRWIPMLQENAFRRKLSQRRLGEPLPFIVYPMIVGVLRIVNVTERLFADEELEEKIEYAMTKTILAANSSLSVESLQALITLAFSLLVGGEHAKAWPIIGSLSKSAEYLQLNVEEPEWEEQSGLVSPTLLPKSKDWIEEEERRRVFWNIFILDRICSITAGYRIGLTGDNVCRRLPLCGTHWNTDTFGMSPFFGIWDRSVAKIDNSIASLPEHYPSPEQFTAVNTGYPGATASRQATGAQSLDAIDLSTVGAFAYYIEALESLCRVDMYFLRQKVDFANPNGLASWLTRFKELDMRMVQWRTLLPSKWKDPDVPPEETGTLDPNMTLAHITHNTSMIFLHQSIGYLDKQLSRVKLPKFFSAETCRLAAAEIATIARKYLASSPHLMPLSPQFCFCLCVSAKALLVHCQHYGPELDSFFWVLLEALDEAARRSYCSSSQHNSLAGQFAAQLRQLHKQLRENPSVKLKILNTFGDPYIHGNKPSQRFAAFSSSNGPSNTTPPIDSPFNRTKNSSSQENHGIRTQRSNILPNSAPLVNPTNTPPGPEQPTRPKSPSTCIELPLPSHLDCDDWTNDYLSGILDGFGDASFTDMDRVISFSDMDFTTI